MRVYLPGSQGQQLRGDVMSRLLAFSKANPLTFGVVFSTLKTSAADLLVQLQFEQKKVEDIDWKRNSAFALFGCFYLGGVQYMLYVPIFGRMFPKAAEFATKPISEKLKDPRGFVNMLSQVFLDQCIHHPIAYFPVFYSLKEVMAGNSISDGLAKYQTNWKEDLVALWKVWVPATMFNFTFSPMWLRIPCVATTSLLWTCILSAMRGSDAPPLDSSESIDAIGAQGTLLLHMQRPHTLDPNLDHVIIVATGHDGPGKVSSITRAIHEGANGSVSESKMVKMGGHFMSMMVVSLDSVNKLRLEKAMRDEEVGDLDVRILDISESNREASLPKSGLRRCKTAPGTKIVSFKMQGPDQPGMTAKFTDMLATQGLNIERLETTVSLSADAQPIFNIVCDATVPPSVDMASVETGIAGLEASLGVAINMENALGGVILRK